MAGIAQMARAHQPGLIVVDRSVHGPFENYRTPEQHVPDEILAYPWETNMSMSQSWSFVRDPQYKTSFELIQLIVRPKDRGRHFCQLGFLGSLESTMTSEDKPGLGHYQWDQDADLRDARYEVVYISRTIDNRVAWVTA